MGFAILASGIDAPSASHIQPNFYLVRVIKERSGYSPLLNLANLGFEVIHERNACKVPINLAVDESALVTLIASAING